MSHEFINRPTAAEFIHNGQDDDQVAQIYRRAGAWLHDLHGFQPAIEYAFRPRWMTLSIHELLNAVPQEIVAQSQAMADEMAETAQHLKGIVEARVFSHGDPPRLLNLIVGQGEMIGLDFTEASEKLAVYDIVDFLKSDVFRDAPASEIDRSGIIKANKATVHAQIQASNSPGHPGFLHVCADC